MRKSSASWKSRSVSSGSRRSSSHLLARSFSFGSSASARAQSSACLGFVPVKDLFPGPQPRARPLADVLVQALEVRDTMRRAGDVWMHADRHHARSLLAFLVQAIERIDAAAQPLLGRMVL